MRFLKKEDGIEKKKAMLQSFQDASVPIVLELKKLGKQSERSFHVEERINIERGEYKIAIMAKSIFEDYEENIQVGYVSITAGDRALQASVSFQPTYLTNIFSWNRSKISHIKMSEARPKILQFLKDALHGSGYLKLTL